MASDLADRAPADEARIGPTPGRIAVVAIAGVALLFGAGVLAGVALAFADTGVRSPVKAAAAIAAGLALVGGSAAVLIRTLPKLDPGEASPRTRRARTMLYVSMAIGGVLGAVLQIGALRSNPDGGFFPLEAFSGPVSPAIAIFAIAVWLIAVPIVSIHWWRNVDEHEALAYKDGALAGIYAYSAIAPTWWMGWRGGFLPEPQEILIYAAVVTVWGLVWMQRRYA